MKLRGTENGGMIARQSILVVEQRGTEKKLLRCFALRCCLALCCVVLLCIELLRCASLRCVALCCVALHCVAMRRVDVALRCVEWMLRCVELHCVALCCVALPCVEFMLRLEAREGHGSGDATQVRTARKLAAVRDG